MPDPVFGLTESAGGETYHLARTVNFGEEARTGKTAVEIQRQRGRFL